MLTITIEQAKRFILSHQGLVSKIYSNHQGMVKYVENIGCLQYDPIDVVGKNAELVLYSRVANFQKSMLYDALYQTRELMDQWDKNMAIILSKDLPMFYPVQNNNIKEYTTHLENYPNEITYVRNRLKESDGLTANDLKLDQSVVFYQWRHTRLSQAILDYLFFKGEAIIHHRKDTIRYFDLTDKHLFQNQPSAENPHQHIVNYHAWHVLRRIRSVGLLWNKRSDAFLGIVGLKQKERNAAWDHLIEDDKIVSIAIETMDEPFYISTEDLPGLKTAMNENKIEPRIEFLAPLDNLLWDRKLIEKVFDFSYTWEIYTPKEKRVYGHYVLPILYKTDLIGRISMKCDRKNRLLVIEDVWIEKPVDEAFEALLSQKLEHFAQFNECSSIKNNRAGQ